MRKQFLFLLAGLLSFTFVKGQETRKYSNEFLNIGVGARALGMSNSVVASTNDVYSGYWNPAGLVKFEDNIQLALMHSSYFSGIANYDYGAFATHLNEKSAIGVSVVRFGVDGIPNTFDLIRNGVINYDRVKSFSAVDYGILLTYAQKTNIEGLSWGTNAKIVRRKVGSFANSWGFGLDLGAQYTKNKWQFGAMARDITSTFNAWDFTFTDAEKEILFQTGNDIPKNSLEVTLPKLLLGAGRKFEFGKKLTLLTEANVDVTFDGKRNVVIKGDPASFDPHMGIELGYGNFVFLRSGVGNIQQEKDLDGKKNTTFQPNIGVGLKFKAFQLDYAFTDIGNQSAAVYSNVFSLRLAINRSEENK